jgi:hypothetical protein
MRTETKQVWVNSYQRKQGKYEHLKVVVIIFFNFGINRAFIDNSQTYPEYYVCNKKQKLQVKV